MSGTRRAFLGKLVAAPVVGSGFVKDAQARLAGIQGVGATSSAAMNSEAPVVGEGCLKFSDFSTWWRDIGMQQVRREAASITIIDPDLAVMQLPLTTKFRIQRNRNFDRLKADKQSWFRQRLGASGIVEWWP